MPPGCHIRSGAERAVPIDLPPSSVFLSARPTAHTSTDSPLTHCTQQPRQRNCHPARHPSLTHRHLESPLSLSLLLLPLPPVCLSAAALPPVVPRPSLLLLSGGSAWRCSRDRGPECPECETRAGRPGTPGPRDPRAQHESASPASPVTSLQPHCLTRDFLVL